MKKLFFALLIPAFALGLSAADTPKKEPAACCCKTCACKDKCTCKTDCKDACKDACKEGCKQAKAKK